MGTHWIAGYSVREAHSTPGAGTYVPIRFSDDEGATWTAENTYLDSDPVVGLDLGGSCYFHVCPNGDVIMLKGSGVDGAYVDLVYRSTDGGKTWTSAASGIADPELRMVAGYGCTYDGVIYVPLHKFTSQPGNAKPWNQEVWVSSDNGASWSLRGTVPWTGDSGNEFSVMQTSGNGMIAVCRDNALAVTWQNTSDDLGATWSDPQAITYMGVVQMPRMRKYADGILLFGREGVKGVENVRDVVWYSPNDGVTWCRKFYPGNSTYGDAAYNDVLQRADGTFYMLSYAGTDSAAAITSAVFEIA